MIKRGVRQGCVLSPLIFNVYSDYIFKEAVTDRNGGIKINDTPLKNLRYADNTVLVVRRNYKLSWIGLLTDLINVTVI